MWYIKMLDVFSIMLLVPIALLEKSLKSDCINTIQEHLYSDSVHITTYKLKDDFKK